MTATPSLIPPSPPREGLEAELERTRAELAAVHAELLRLRADARQQQDFLRNVIDTVPGFVCVKELEGRFALANRGLAEAYGTSPEALVGKTDHDFNDDSVEVASFIEDDRQVILDRRTKHIPAEKFTGRNGEERWLQTTKVPLVERDGSCSRLLAVAMDITERRRLEQELLQAQKLQAIGQLAGGVAHDFNNALTGILGAADLLESELPADATTLREHCRVIAQAGEHAARLTHELLAFSRKAPINKREVDVHDVIGNVVRLLERTLDRRITVLTRLAPGRLLSLADPLHLQNAVLNLAVNARDAMPDGGTLTIATSDVTLSAGDGDDDGWKLPPGRYVELSVVDTGTGMDARTRQHLFEPFFTTKPIGRGTGLGLSSVYGTVVSHGGKIVVRSEPGHGSMFKLYLPAVATEPPRASRPELEPSPRRGAGRILIVDDERVVRIVARRMLERMGYDVEDVPDGDEALRRYAACPFDLVVLDVIMPRLGGPAVFEALRARHPAAKVLLASGFSPEGRVAHLLASGACGFLDKPFREAELARAVSAALKAGRSASSFGLASTP